MDVVADARREHAETADCDDQLAVDVFNVVVERIELEHHWQAGIVAEELASQRAVLRRLAAHPHGHGRLGCNADVQIAGAVRGIHRDEALEQPFAQLLAHALPAHDSVHAVRAPVEAVRLAELEEFAQEGWVPGDDEYVTWSEERQCEHALRA